MTKPACPLGSMCGPPTSCIIGVLILVAVFVGIYYYGKKKGWPCCRSNSGEKTAGEILDSKYAEGSISKEEYEQKKKDLGG